MGLKITDQIFTDSGETSEMYINIKNFEYKKDQEIGLPQKTDTLHIYINTYLNEADRIADSSNTARSKAVALQYSFIDDGTIDDFKDNDNAFDFSYSLIKQELQSLGYNTVDV